MASNKVFTFEAEPYKEGGKIQLITNDEGLYDREKDYISTLLMMRIIEDRSDR